MKRLLDAHGDTLKVFHYDHATDTAYIESRVADVTPALERNKAAQKDYGILGRGRALGDKIAEIDVNTYLNWIHEAGHTWYSWHRLPKAERSRLLARKLNDPDYRYLRAYPGRL